MHMQEEITVWGRKDLKDVEDSNLGLEGITDTDRKSFR